jgi:threonine synthase
MQTSRGFVGLDCVNCDERFDPETIAHRCPECGGILDPTYAYDEIADELTRADIEQRRFDTMWRYDDVLPFPREAAVTMDEGATALVECPSFAERLGVGRVVLKDEGRNPTGTFKDRGQTVAVTAAAQHGTGDIALNSAGNAGQAAAAYASQADLAAHVFLPSRAGFTQKAMTLVHDADLTVVEGEIDDAGAAYADAMEEEDTDWYSVKTFVTPYRHEGKKTMLYEIVEQLDWEVPDAVVYPTGGGVGLVGMHKAATELQRLGLVDDEDRPAMYAAQASGCAPVVEAWEHDRDVHESWESPDTICGGIAVPDPGASPLILDALDESNGGAIATTDDAILDSAIALARDDGIEMGATCAAAASGAIELAERGEFDGDETIVLLNTGAGNKDDDVLRGHIGTIE